MKLLQKFGGRCSFQITDQSKVNPSETGQFNLKVFFFFFTLNVSKTESLILELTSWKCRYHRQAKEEKSLLFRACRNGESNDSF